MRILVSIGHPGQIHLLKNFIWKMEARGMRVRHNSQGEINQTFLQKKVIS